MKKWKKSEKKNKPIHITCKRCTESNEQRREKKNKLRKGKTTTWQLAIWTYIDSYIKLRWS